MKIFLFGLLIVCPACATTTHEQVTAADGRPAMSTSCRASSTCVEEAEATCNGRYQVVDHEELGAAVKTTGNRVDSGGSKEYLTYRCDTVAH